MEYPIELPIIMFSLPTQEVSDVQYHKVILYQDRFEIQSKFRYTEENEDKALPAEKDLLCDDRQMCFKSFISATDCYYHRTNQKYKVVISVAWVSQDVYVWFKTRHAAHRFTDVINAWLTNSLNDEILQRFTGKKEE